MIYVFAQEDVGDINRNASAQESVTWSSVLLGGDVLLAVAEDGKHEPRRDHQ